MTIRSKIFMKTYKQKKKRMKARKRGKPSVWVYMSMNHVCPNSTKPTNRKYYVYDDISKLYVSDPYNKGYSKTVNMQELTGTIAAAGKFENFIADRFIKQLKGTGAWRPIRIK